MAKRSNFYEVGKKILSNKYLTDIYDLDNSDVVKDIDTIKNTFPNFKAAMCTIQYYSEKLGGKGEDLVLHYKLNNKIFDIKYKFNFARIIFDFGEYNDLVYIKSLGFTPLWVICVLDILRRNEDKFKGKEFSPYKRQTKKESKPKCKPADGTKEKSKFSYNYDLNNSDLENFKNIIKVFLRRNCIQSNLLRLTYDDDLRELCHCIKNNFTIRDLVRCFRRTLSSSLSDCPKELSVYYMTTTLNFTFNTSLNVIEVQNSDGLYSYGVIDDEPVDNYLIMYVLAYVVQNVEKVSRIVGLTIGESTVPTNSFLESKNSTKEKNDYESVVEESNPTPIPTTVTSDNELVIDISGTEESKPKCKPADDIKEKSKFSYTYDSNNSDFENFKNIIKVFLKRNSIYSNRYWLTYNDDVKELCNCIKDNFTVRSLMGCFSLNPSSSLSYCPKELFVYYKTKTLVFIFNTTPRTIEIQSPEGQYTYRINADDPVDNYIIMYVLAFVIQNVEKVSKIVGLITEENIFPNNRLPSSKISIEDKTDYESKVVENNPALKPSINTTVSDNEFVIDISGTDEIRGSFDKAIKFENAIKAFDSKFKILNINVNFINNQVTIQFDSKLSGTVIKELLLTTD